MKASSCSQPIQDSTPPSVFSKLCIKLSPKKMSAQPQPETHDGLSIEPCTPHSNQFKQVFQHFDENGDGKISPSELQTCLRTVGGELSTAEAVSVVESLDSDGDGLLGLKDFAKLMKADGEEERRKALREAFRMYEMNESGSITPNSLKTMLSRLGEEKTVEECEAIICNFDLDGDGVLSFEEFSVMMTS